jgi:predicted membrane chloride channel (bestrophin family)
MAIIEYSSTVSYRSLMNKSKPDLAHEVLSLMDFCHRKELKRQEYENKLKALLEALECQKVDDLVQNQSPEMLAEVGKKIAMAAKIGGRFLDLS